MGSITGFGGAFLRAADPEALYRWYERHLGLVRTDGYIAFPASTARAPILLTFVAADEQSFPPAQTAMINLQVDDLDEMLDRLRDDGVPVDPERATYDFGRFGWCTDPEGNRVELWQPAADG